MIRAAKQYVFSFCSISSKDYYSGNKSKLILACICSKDFVHANGMNWFHTIDNFDINIDTNIVHLNQFLINYDCFDICYVTMASLLCGLLI